MNDLPAKSYHFDDWITVSYKGKKSGDLKIELDLIPLNRKANTYATAGAAALEQMKMQQQMKKMQHTLPGLSSAPPPGPPEWYRPPAPYQPPSAPYFPAYSAAPPYAPPSILYLFFFKLKLISITSLSPSFCCRRIWTPLRRRRKSQHTIRRAWTTNSSYLCLLSNSALKWAKI